MKSFMVYETSTGKIVRYGTIQEENFEGQAGEGQTVIEGHPGNGNHIVNGSPTFIPDPDRTPEELSAADNREHTAAIQRKTSDILLDLENRLRAIEKKAPITKNDFRAQVRGK